MKVEMSPTVYLALCALVQDGLEVESDATPILRLAAKELASGLDELKSLHAELADHSEALEHLRSA